MSALYKNKLLFLLLSIFIYINLIYLIHPFVFGSASNVEELPYIYKDLNLANYEKDDFVKFIDSYYTQVTPYVFLISSLAKVFSLNKLVILFYFMHMITSVLFFLSIRKLFNAVGVKNDLIVVCSLISLMILIDKFYFLPNQRWIFYDFLDPEYMTFPFVLFSIGLHVTNKNIFASIFLFVATLLHPLYSIMLLPAFVISSFYKMQNLKDVVRNVLMYVLAVFPYSIFVAYKGRQTVSSIFDTSLIVEIIRAPHHYTIPQFSSLDKITVYFYLYFFLLALFIFSVYYLFKNTQEVKRNFQNPNLIKLIVFVSSVMMLLILISMLSEFVRIPILVRLTPYRVGLIIVLLMWIMFFSSINFLIEWKIKNIQNFSQIIMFLLLIAVCVLLQIESNKFSQLKIAGSQKDELITWIKNNTDKNALFLNYSDTDIRTSALRSDFFRFDTPPIVADGEVSWYKRYLIYFDIPVSINPVNYQAVKNYAQSKHEINLERVVMKASPKINYVVLQVDNKSTSRIADLMNLKNKNYKFKTTALNLKFKNSSYEVYSTKEN